MNNTDLARIIGAMVEAFDQTIDAKVKAALADRTADRLEAHIDQPEPRRVTCAACASGEVAGAIRSGRRWVASRASWAAWRAARATPPASAGAVVHLDIVRAAARRAGGRP